MHPLEPGTSPVPGCCTHAACLTITRAAQLVVRVAAVLDQVLHIAMFNLCRLCTAPVCRQRMLSWPRRLSPGHHPHLWQVPPHSCPAPRLLPAKLPLASSEPQCSHLCPGRYLWRLQSPARSRPGQQSAALQACREERAHSAEGPYPLLPVCGLYQDHCPVQAHALSLGLPPPEGRGLTPHHRGCPSDTDWRSCLGQTQTLLLWRTRLQCWDPDRFPAQHESCHSSQQGEVLSQASRTHTLTSLTPYS